MTCKRKEARGEKVLPKLLEIDEVRKYYYSRSDEHWLKPDLVKAVDGINLNIFEGETLGLVGESGCGKSTLGRVIVGLEKPSEGKICYKGKDLETLGKEQKRQARLDLQMIFQDPFSALNPRKRIFDILSAPLLYHKIVEQKDIESEVYRILELVGLPRDSVRRYPHEFSGGQLQRVGIAAALSLKPRLIVCDEPVSALDVSIQAQILNLLRELQEELGLTYLFIAHGLAAVKYISDRIAVMYLGRIVELAPAEELFNRPLHPYTQALISASPIPHPDLVTDQADILKGEIPSNIDPPSGCPFHPRCPLATDRCRRERPVMQSDGTYNPEGDCRSYRKSHCVACPPAIQEAKDAKEENRHLSFAFNGAKRTAEGYKLVNGKIEEQ